MKNVRRRKGSEKEIEKMEKREEQCRKIQEKKAERRKKERRKIMMNYGK